MRGRERREVGEMRLGRRGGEERAVEGRTGQRNGGKGRDRTTLRHCHTGYIQ